MTGCGYGRIQGEQVIVTVEVKSINSRYLDINCKLPRAYSRIEEKIKAFAGKYTTRGKLDIYVTVETAPGAAGTLFQIDEAYLLNYLECLEQLRDKFGLRDDISVMRVAQNKDVFTGARQEDTADELWERVLPALEKAFEIYPEVRLVVVAHLYGVPGKIDEIKRICSQHHALIVEDAAESFGASYKGIQTGTFGDVSVISYNGNNVLETEMREMGL